MVWVADRSPFAGGRARDVSARRRAGLARALAAAIGGAALVSGSACAPPEDVDDDDAHSEPPEGDLVLRHFDVGQADATLVQAPDATILIDAGDWQRDDVVPHLESAGVGAIDLLVLTHPHADHIGQVPEVLDAFPVSEIWMSGWEHDTRTFEDVLSAALNSHADYVEPRAGDTERIGDVRVHVLSPEEPLADIHDNIAVRLEYGAFSAIYTGDAESGHEAEMIGRDAELGADLLQLGHHGSNTSSSREFLEAVDPEVAVYMAGEDNQFGHPHTEVVRRVGEMGIPLYGTDVSGSIAIQSDGEEFEILGGVENVASAWKGGDRAFARAECVDLNGAAEHELEAIVHVGSERAAEIVHLRPFEEVADLADVSGLGSSRVNDIKEEGLACAR